jgi:hypothetical protein
VFDQYLAFAALESGLFSLAQPHSYLALNDPAAKARLLSSPCALAWRLFQHACHDAKTGPPFPGGVMLGWIQSP